MTPLHRSWARWLRTRRLAWRVCRLRRKVEQQRKVLLLQLEYLRLVEQLEHPMLLVPPELLPKEPPLVPLPEKVNPPDPLTPEELAEMREWAERDPLQEIQARLAPSTTPPSPPISVG